ncbi:hypothetical protein CTAYLR_001302 [Chrysophaeum taylorii]|uniref:SSD domain-containing protein n=1 Tax=Chrysophaeum taylorii TaxID=2483200 RepID=A0AAD7XLD5_9STRA|nr:hypothetical protein CTAYLR_001302 [Chrysophaeum taylorii]
MSSEAEDDEKDFVERGFYNLGYAIQVAWWAFLLGTLGVFLGLSSGMEDAKIEDDFYGYQVVKPQSRINREVSYYENRVDDGYVSGAENMFGMATRGGKNVLTRKNLKQLAGFSEDLNLEELAIEYRGTRFSGRDVLTFSGGTPQPFRYSILDCWQEGSFDFTGTVLSLNPAAAVAIESIEFAIGVFDEDAILTVTPYNWCLYARVSILFSAVPEMDPGQFGRCRQFLDDEIVDEDPAMAALAAAHDYYRFYVYDMVKSTPSWSQTWGCRRPFTDDAEPGRCGDAMTCCEITVAKAGCACVEMGADCASDYAMPEVLGGGMPNATSCAAFASMTGGSPSLNDEYYDASYAALDACAPFDFFPVSPTLAGALTYIQGVVTPSARPSSTEVRDACGARYAAYEETSDDVVAAIVQAGVEKIVCDFFGAGYDCARTLTSDDFDWRWDRYIATEDDLVATGLSGRCALWDGGPEGLDIFPYIDERNVLGGVWDDGARAIQFLYISSGPKKIADSKNAAGEDVSNNECEEGRKLWLSKFSRTCFGRHDGGSMIFGAISSVSLSTTFEKQTIPEVPILIIGYGLVLAYAIFVGAWKGVGSLRAKASFAAMSFVGVLFVFLGLAAGWGLAAGFMNIKLNVSIIQVLPFLTVGLGVNDMFIVCHAYSRVLTTKTKAAAEESIPIADVLADVGPAITLTTVANACAFLIGRFLEMRLLRDFSTVAAICSITIFLCILFGFTALLAMHARCVSKGILVPADNDNMETADEFSARDEGTVARSVARYAEKINETKVHGPLLIVALVLVLVLGLVYIPEASKSTGMPGGDLFVRGTSEYVGLGIASSKIKLEPNFLMHRNFDFAHLHPYFAPLNVGDYSLVERFGAAKKTEDNPSTWYHIFASWAAPCSWDSLTIDNVAASDCEANEFFRSASAYNSRCRLSDPFSGGNCGPRVSPKNFTAAENLLVSVKRDLYSLPGNSGLASSEIPVCTLNPVWTYMCGDTNCFDGYLRDEDLAVDRDPALLAVHPDYAYECLNIWLNSDEQWTILNPLLICEDPTDPAAITMCEALSPGARKTYRGKDGTGDFEFSQTLVFVKDTGQDAPPWVNFLDSAMSKMNKFYRETGIKGWCGNNSARFFAQFRWLENRLWLTILYGLILIFGLLVIFMFFHGCSRWPLAHRLAAATWLALVTVLNILASIVLVVAIFVAAGFRLNCFSAVNILMCVGFGVEFTAHIVLVYARKPAGNNASRLSHALVTMLPPIVDGSVSTLLSIVPLAASKFPYVVSYFFGLYMLISCVGLYIGCVVLPSCMAAFGYSKLFYDSPEDDHVAAVAVVADVKDMGDENDDDPLRRSLAIPSDVD